MVALSEDEALLSRLFQHRFKTGSGLKGHTFGNLFLTALTQIIGDFGDAVKLSSEILAIRGRIFPSTRANVSLEARLLAHVPALLAGHQPNFARTGGLHAACAITAAGEVLASAEDVGRHNAVDKVVGKLLYAELLPRAQADEQRTARVLAVSGRASFEIVQKAAAAGFACVASVSAPSSLAVDTAAALGVTLASFVREGRFTLYAHAARVR